MEEAQRGAAAAGVGGRVSLPDVLKACFTFSKQKQSLVKKPVFGSFDV